jgi:hypothetical protein
MSKHTVNEILEESSNHMGAASNTAHGNNKLPEEGSSHMCGSTVATSQRAGFREGANTLQREEADTLVVQQIWA